MDVRIAVDFAGRGLEDLGFDALREPQHVDRAVHAGLERLHRIELIVNRRGRAGQIVDFVDLDIKTHRDVVAHDFEARVGQEMLDVLASAGIIIVDAKNLVAFGQKPLAKMRANETRAARNSVRTREKLINLTLCRVAKRVFLICGDCPLARI